MRRAEPAPGIGGVKRPDLVDRLDKDTTGLMVVAESDAVHRALSKQFAEKADGPLKPRLFGPGLGCA